MTKIIVSIALLLSFFLTGCAGSVVKNISHPSRNDFTIDGIKVAVVRYPDKWVSWFVSSELDEIAPPLPRIKLAQVAAIEAYSKCRVVGADFQPGSLQSAYLEAIVECD